MAEIFKILHCGPAQQFKILSRIQPSLQTHSVTQPKLCPALFIFKSETALILGNSPISITKIWANRRYLRLYLY